MAAQAFWETATICVPRRRSARSARSATTNISFDRPAHALPCHRALLALPYDRSLRELLTFPCDRVLHALRALVALPCDRVLRGLNILPRDRAPWALCTGRPPLRSSDRAFRALAALDEYDRVCLPVEMVTGLCSIATDC